jgi:outer membrane protein assembly factor BamB
MSGSAGHIPMVQIEPRPRIARAWYRAALAVMIITGTTTLLLGGWMVVDHLRGMDEDPTDSSALAEARQAVAASANDAAAIEQLRRIDQQVRHRFFTSQRRVAIGGWLLIGGFVLFVVSGRVVAEYHHPLPRIDQQAGASASAHRAWAGGAIASAGFVVLLLAGVAVLAGRSVTGYPMSQPADASAEAAAARAAAEDRTAIAAPPPSPEQFAANWFRFRGPQGSGTWPVAEQPMTWDGQAGRNIAWKTAIDLPGANSAVVWGDAVFCTGADADNRAVYCFDANTGELRWRKSIVTPGSRRGMDEVFEDTGYAAPTAATDGRHVFAIFANGDLAALDVNDGAVAWSKYLGPLENIYTHATSLTLWRDHLIVLLDQGDRGGGLSAVMALDVNTGQPIWRTQRSVGASWATPIVITTEAGDRLITAATPYVSGYDVETGEELWWVDCMGADVAPSPIYAGGLIVIPSPWEQMTAIRPGGVADATQTHIAWQTYDGVPDITSPVSDGDVLYTLDTMGMLSCFELESGRTLWQEDLGMEFNASPTIAGDRLYLIGKDGRAIVGRVGRTFEKLTEASLGEPVRSSPALTDRSIYLRGDRHLWCIRAEPPAD